MDEPMDVLDAQIRNLQATVEQLLQRRAETAEHVRQHESILSPIRRVPAELICEIFSLTLSNGGFPDAELHSQWAVTKHHDVRASYFSLVKAEVNAF
jgi:hypothetical protein